MSSARMGVLHGEHVLLGATFEPGFDDLLAVCSYACEKDDAVFFEGAEKDGALLCDLTGCAYVLVSGDGAGALVGTALCGDELAVGSAAFEGVLTGDGSLISTPLAVRTGDREIVLVDPSCHGEALVGWLSFLAGAEQGGVRPFAGTLVEPASEMLVALLLAGPAAERVLADYVSSPARLPRPAEVLQAHLDAIPAVLVGIPGADELPRGYLVLVPPARARALWRSLLSFGEISPVGHETLRRILCDTVPWGGFLATASPAHVSAGNLKRWHLLREGADFIGARGLVEGSDAADNR
ncbi:hypothetical protein [Thermophilibacter provencensis]|uniref:GCVT N-terminal domain-containing protein n=1 Tax=Thermophilibacter provencensis TaxID=1852386 RepID=A0ABT7V4T7_9ACTN|nr:hypothetical protein [Thermophilibacter provencensis]MDM8270996.1 hypothetical protein [Thermophilibacter provencensis]